FRERLPRVLRLVSMPWMALRHIRSYVQRNERSGDDLRPQLRTAFAHLQTKKALSFADFDREGEKCLDEDDSVDDGLHRRRPVRLKAQVAHPRSPCMLQHAWARPGRRPRTVAYPR